MWEWWTTRNILKMCKEERLMINTDMALPRGRRVVDPLNLPLLWLVVMSNLIVVICCMLWACPFLSSGVVDFLLSFTYQWWVTVPHSVVLHQMVWASTELGASQKVWVSKLACWDPPRVVVDYGMQLKIATTSSTETGSGPSITSGSVRL